MAVNIIVMLLEVYKTIWNAFVRKVSVKNSNNGHGIYLSAAFITMIVACIAAINQGRLLFTVRRLTK